MSAAELENIILSFTDIYPAEMGEKICAETGIPKERLVAIDMTDISGTDMYCDDAAEEKIRERLAHYGHRGIHFIDSGNYHYMSRIFTSMIDEPYELVFFDHHTDMKPPMFEGLLSCGDWAEEVLQKDQNLKRLIMIGPPESAISELSEDLKRDERLVCISEEMISKDPIEEIYSKINGRQTSSGGNPLLRYISVDKDILSEKYVLTNWDQGSVSMDRLLSIIDAVCKDYRIIGADICGGLPNPSPEKYHIAEMLGISSDLDVMKCILKYMKN
ncbi:MAG: arginase family protein [Lachnospiraceae bacterium]|nr:arginase family protein [Lachnospiraceae bacterium]